MSLERLIPQATPKNGVYCLFWHQGQLVLFSLPSEDTANQGKREGDVYLDHDLTPLTPTMLSIISGGVKAGERAEDAILREVYQEGGLALQPGEVSKRPVQTHTIQERKGRGLFYIQGVGFEHELSERGLAEARLHLARENRHLSVVPVNELLNQDTSYQLRPFMSALVHSLVATTQ